MFTWHFRQLLQHPFVEQTFCAKGDAATNETTVPDLRSENVYTWYRWQTIVAHECSTAPWIILDPLPWNKVISVISKGWMPLISLNNVISFHYYNFNFLAILKVGFGMLLWDGYSSHQQLPAVKACTAGCLWLTGVGRITKKRPIVCTVVS